MEKIPLFKKRNLGETIGAAFELLRVNFRLISVSFLIMVMPLLLLCILLVSMGFIGFMKQKLSYISGSGGGTASVVLNMAAMLIGYFGYFLTLFIQAVVLHEVVIAYEHSDDPQNIKVSDVWQLIKGDLGRIVLSFLGVIPLSVLLFILAAVIYAVGFAISSSAAGLSILIIYLINIYVNVCLSNYLMLRLRSEYNIFTSIGKSFSLTVGRWRWWRTLGVHFVMTLVAISFYFVSMIPFSVLIYLFRVHLAPTMARDEILTWMYVVIGAALAYAGVVFAYFINLVLLGSTVNYYSLVEEKEHVGLQVDIEQIGMVTESDKKQEGEY
jgi:hypothetical protein